VRRGTTIIDPVVPNELLGKIRVVVLKVLGIVDSMHAVAIKLVSLASLLLTLSH